MPIPLFQVFGKVVAFRLNRPKQKGRTRHNSITTNHDSEGISSIPANTSARYSGGVSFAREASDMAQVALPLVQTIAGAIPLVGAPMQAAISGLLTGLQVIDRRSQNKSDLDCLTLRLNRLCLNFCNAPPARDPLEQFRRDSFVRMLQGTSARVATLHERCLASTSITQTIAGCFMDIDRYLADYLWSFQIQSQHDIHEELEILRRQNEDHKKLLVTIQSLMIPQSSTGPSASRRAIALSCVTLVDATGHHHEIPVNFCTSYQQLNGMLRVLFQRESDAIEAQIQGRYIEKGHTWPGIEAGTKIVMRVTIQQQTASFSEVDYKCHFCGAVNRLVVEPVKDMSRGRTVCSTDCRKCKRRFQITRALVPSDQLRRSSNSDSNRATDAETRLIRNFHVQQVLWHLWWKKERRREFSRLACETPGMSPRPGHVSRAHDAASRRLSKIVIRRRGGWKKAQTMSLCSSGGWRIDVVIAQSSDVIMKLCRIECSLGDTCFPCTR